MNLRERVNETVRISMELKRETDDALLASLHTALAVVRTLCILARQETGNQRSHHVEQANIALATAIELAGRLNPGKRERDEIEEVRRDVLSVGVAPSRA